MHSMITNKGRALKVLFERLHRAAYSEQDEWKEEKALRSVSSASTHSATELLTFNFKGDALRQYDPGLRRIKLLDA